MGRFMWERKEYLWHFPFSSLHLPNSCFQYVNNLGKQSKWYLGYFSAIVRKRPAGREGLSLIGSFHLIHGGFYPILFLNKINLKKNHCSTHTVFKKCMLPGFKRAGSIIEANIKYIKWQMETHAGTTQGEFFFDRKYFQELLQNFQATWDSLDRIRRLSASSYTILLMFWSTNWKTCLFIYSFFSPKVFCPDIMRLCGIIEGNEILELELKSSAS